MPEDNEKVHRVDGPELTLINEYAGAVLRIAPEALPILVLNLPFWARLRIVLSLLFRGTAVIPQ
jgi:hypothetical protein